MSSKRRDLPASTLKETTLKALNLKGMLICLHCDKAALDLVLKGRGPHSWFRVWVFRKIWRDAGRGFRV